MTNDLVCKLAANFRPDRQRTQAPHCKDLRTRESCRETAKLSTFSYLGIRSSSDDGGLWIYQFSIHCLLSLKKSSRHGICTPKLLSTCSGSRPPVLRA